MNGTAEMVVEIWFDGGCRSNPHGPAAGGAVIRDRDGRTLRHVGKHIGVASNNVAEWSGLIAGLQAALDLGATRAAVFGDSQLVVRQFSGEYAVHDERLRGLFMQALDLRKRFAGEVVASHVPREMNKAADAICRAVLDGTYVDGEDPALASGESIEVGFVVEVAMDRAHLRAALADGATTAAVRKQLITEVERKLMLCGVVGTYSVRVSRTKG